MAEEPPPLKGATPPGGGRWDHDTMRDAAERPVTGPASNDVLAASGGLEVPGRRARVSKPSDLPVQPEPIPGERDASTVIDRQPGAIGGRPSGADTPTPASGSLMDDATVHDRVLEGGGRSTMNDD